jgi:VWFA-related protein
MQRLSFRSAVGRKPWFLHCTDPMKKTSPVPVVLLSFATAAAAIASGAPPSAQDSESVATFPSKVELITVDAVVVDSAGKPVSGLTRGDFSVTEDGQPRDIASFEAFSLEAEGEGAEPAPAPPVADNQPTNRRTGRAFAILVDDLRLPRHLTQDTRAAIRHFIEDSLADGDEVTLGTTSGKVWWSARVPEGRDDLLAVLGRIEGSYLDPRTRESMTEYEAFWIENFEQGSSLSTQGSLSEQLDDPASILQRVVARFMAQSLCGDPEHGLAVGCEGIVKSAAAGIESVRRQRTRLVLLAVRRALDALAPVRGRTSLLLFSPGFLQDNRSIERDIAGAARETNTAVYFVDARGLVTDSGVGTADVGGGLSSMPDDPRSRAKVRFEEAVLESAGAVDLADNTGGFAVRNTNDLEGATERIAEESRVFYLLGFYPAPGKSPKEWRKLKVEVKRPGLTVRARKGFTLRSAVEEARKDSAKAEKKRDKAKVEPSASVARALESTHAIPDIPLRAMTFVMDPRADGKVHVVVDAEINAGALRFETKGNTKVARVEVTVAALQRDSGKGFIHDDPVEITVPGAETPGWRGLVREFELPPGVSQVRVVVRDMASGALGAVTQRFEVPEPGALRVSSPILTDRVEPAKDGRGRPRAALAAHRTFVPAGGLYCEFEVFGAARDAATGLPRVTAGLEVRTAQGQVVRRADPTAITPDQDGRVVRLLGMPLAGMAEGSYDLVLQIQDLVDGAKIERSERFSLSGNPDS